MPFCKVCNRYYGSEKARRSHAKHELNRINEKSKIELMKNLKKTIESAIIVEIKTVIETHIPIHEEPQKKRKNNLACKALRNLGR